MTPYHQRIKKPLLPIINQLNLFLFFTSFSFYPQGGAQRLADGCLGVVISGLGMRLVSGGVLGNGRVTTTVQDIGRGIGPLHVGFGIFRGFSSDGRFRGEGVFRGCDDGGIAKRVDRKSERKAER